MLAFCQPQSRIHNFGSQLDKVINSKNNDIHNYMMIFIHDVYKLIPTYRLALSGYLTRETIHQIGVTLLHTNGHAHYGLRLGYINIEPNHSTRTAQLWLWQCGTCIKYHWLDFYLCSMLLLHCLSPPSLA